jgi:regulator of sirC expression with transglutaminase-like and TPR domain
LTGAPAWFPVLPLLVPRTRRTYHGLGGPTPPGSLGDVEATERFAALFTKPEPQLRLDEAGLLIAAHAYPGLDIDAELGRLDVLAEGCRNPTLDALVRYLFVEEGFRGNHTDYYDPRNSYLNDVTTRRVGIPITLCVLTLEVGRRIGVPLAGVGMPGHFILRDRVDPEVWVDPFSRGALLDRVGCERAFLAVNGSDAVFEPDFLEPVGAWTIVARMLANLKAVFTRRGDAAALAWALELRCHVPGMPLGEFGAWAEALAAAGRFDAAADVLESAARRADGERAAAWEASARDLRARLN